MRPPRSGSGGRSCKESWRTSGKRSWGGLKVRNPFPPTTALSPSGCLSYIHHLMLPLASYVPFLYTSLPLLPITSPPLLQHSPPALANR